VSSIAIRLHGSGAALAPGTENQTLEEGNAQGERSHQKILEEVRTALELLVKNVGFRLLGRHDRANVLQEIDAALLALAALPLFMAAGRALISQRRVALWAESRNVARLRAAFWTFHDFSVRESIYRSEA
jgi:hypothetical protein